MGNKKAKELDDLMKEVCKYYDPEKSITIKKLDSKIGGGSFDRFTGAVIKKFALALFQAYNADHENEKIYIYREELRIKKAIFRWLDIHYYALEKYIDSATFEF